MSNLPLFCNINKQLKKLFKLNQYVPAYQPLLPFGLEQMNGFMKINTSNDGEKTVSTSLSVCLNVKALKNNCETEDPRCYGSIEGWIALIGNETQSILRLFGDVFWHLYYNDFSKVKNIVLGCDSDVINRRKSYTYENNLFASNL